MKTLIERAAKFATDAHEGHLRKWTGDPYIVHPAEVAKMMTELGMTDEVVAAAWIHDTVEDCGKTHADILMKFGLEVWHLVKAMSNRKDWAPANKGGPNRAERKAIERMRFAELEGLLAYKAHTLKTGDVLSNAIGIAKDDPGFFHDLWKHEAAKLVEVLTAADPRIMAKLRKVLNS